MCAGVACFFFFNDTATTEIYTLSLHDALPIRAVLRHAFEEMGLRRIDLHTDADNARGIRCHEKCGFVREGVMRERRLRYGTPLDMVVMGVLSHEWGRPEVGR